MPGVRLGIKLGSTIAQMVQLLRADLSERVVASIDECSATLENEKELNQTNMETCLAGLIMSMLQSYES